MSDTNRPFNFEENDDEPEIWDEFQWEKFMQEADRRSAKYGMLLEKYMDHPDRDKIIAKEMGWDWLVDALEAEERGELPEDDDIDELFEDEMNEGEEWKESTGYDADEVDSVKDLPVYQKAFQYGLDARSLVKSITEEDDQEILSEFVGSSSIPAAKIAGGFAMGFDIESLGGNIANCKRGLAASNRALIALRLMREKNIIDEDTFLDFYKRGKSVRDELALYIVELRERFRKGIS